MPDLCGSRFPLWTNAMSDLCGWLRERLPSTATAPRTHTIRQMDSRPTSEFDQVLATWTRAFAAGDTEIFIGLFAEDAQALMHEQPALVGKAAIGQMFRQLFAMVDTAGFEVDYDVVDVHCDDAYVLAPFRETLRPKDGGPSIEVDGRLVCFWHRDGSWKVTRLLTGRSSPERIRS